MLKKIMWITNKKLIKYNFKVLLISFYLNIKHNNGTKSESKITTVLIISFNKTVWYCDQSGKIKRCLTI